MDVGQKIVAHRINGYLVGRILLLLANIHIQPRPIWFSRHGESQYNAQGRIGGDSPLRYGRKRGVDGVEYEVEGERTGREKLGLV